MTDFKGFTPGKTQLTSIPAQFFSELLPQIDDLGELKVTLYAMWALEQMEGEFRYLRFEDFLEDETFMAGMTSREALEKALDRAVKRGTLLQVALTLDEDELRRFYLINTPRGQTALDAIQKGDWQPSGDREYPIALDLERPNIFRLYEQHIGPLTPIMGDVLTEAESTFPAVWIEEAVRIAVENNVRKWRYIQAILDSWQREGKHERTDRRRPQEDARKYVEGEFADFIEH
jgi:DnaD/phage-associated family protein